MKDYGSVAYLLDCLSVINRRDSDWSELFDCLQVENSVKVSYIMSSEDVLETIWVAHKELFRQGLLL